MPAVFADTFYFLALGNRNDLAHGKALAFNQTYTGSLITTGFILTEFADACAGAAHRRAAAVITFNELRANPSVTIIPCTEQLFNDGLSLYENRPDKEWSLTDCVSFIVMQSAGVTEALTADRHFEQAGFIALLK